ncbi:hypothetical protein Pmani_004009 [Petrolisthes manimaculis]|uniref:Uncharacterized protein n=1 Tax=Petrolisthes manimaculis TaxID=1843537 RepID=A0AAE1UPF3_9EUCA|nr:hypothetical protein Pmani_004009 [Petrolisthes manimaculis]
MSRRSARTTQNKDGMRGEGSADPVNMDDNYKEDQNSNVNTRENCGKCDQLVLDEDLAVSCEEEMEVKLDDVQVMVVEDMDTRLGTVETQTMELKEKEVDNYTQNKSLEGRLSMMEAKTIELEDKTSEIDKSNTSTRHRADGTIQEGTDDATGYMPSAISADKTLLDELNERKNKESNIIVYGVPESKSQVIRERINHDRTFTLDLMNNCQVHCDAAKIIKVMRVGKRENGKLRPMRVIISSTDIKLNLLDNLNRLQGKEDYRRVRVTHDMTRMQREQDINLWMEAKNLMAEGKGRHSVRGPPWRRRVVKLVEEAQIEQTHTATQ